MAAAKSADALRHWRLDVGEDRVGWLSFDRGDASANTLSVETMDELDAVLGDPRIAGLAGLVIYSGKASGFIAGADVNEFPSITSEADAFSLVRRGQQVFARLEALPCPTVAVMNGFALGGGLELALACTSRLVFAGSEPVLGLPEIKLGLHPGFGGTVRLPRLIGVRKAMDLMLTGRSIRPADAVRMGLADATVTADDWRGAALRLVQGGVRRRRAGLADRLLASAIARPWLARTLRSAAAAKAPPTHYPAPGALIDLWETHASGDAAFEAEARSFSKLVMTPASRNLVRVFFLQERLKKTGSGAARSQRVHVVGAGVMGGDIAAWCALRGLEVTLQDRELKLIEPALLRASKLFARKLRDPAAIESAQARLHADVEGQGAADADIVIEAVFEDLAVKREVYARLEPLLRPGAVLATNTSSIPLEELGAMLASPGRLIGLHFFNPVAQLPLVEVVAARESSPESLAAGSGLTRQLGKLGLPCRSHPGFLVNRILAPYMGEAMELMREGVPIAEIDQAAVEFGMPVGPIELADSVGLDVAAHVARILEPVIGRPVAPELAQLVERRQLGVKTGRGFYTYRDGKPVRPSLAWGSAKSEVQDRLILALLNEAADCLHEGIVGDADLVDAGVIFGTGFAPFRGGPLQHARDAGIASIESRLRALSEQHGARFAPSPGWALLRH